MMRPLHLLLSFTLLHLAPSRILGQGAEDDAARKVIQGYFSAVENRDLAGLDRCLAKEFSTAQAHTREAFLERMKAYFSKTQGARYDVRVRRIERIPGQLLRVRVAFEGKIFLGPGRELPDEGLWGMYLIREDGLWKLLTFRMAHLDVALLLSRAATAEDRRKLLRDEGDAFLEQEFLPRLYEEQAALLEKGDFDLAVKLQDLAEEAAAAFEDADTRTLQEGIAQLGRGKIAHRQSHYSEAAAAFRKAIDLFRRQKANTFIISVTINLGAVLQAQGDFREAARVLEEARTALAPLNQFARLLNEARLLGNLGSVYTELGQYSRAADCLETSLRAAQKAGDREAGINARLNLANIHLHQARYVEAVQGYERALVDIREAGLLTREATVLTNLGQALAEQGRFAEATRRLTEARGLAVRIKDRSAEASALGNLGNLHYRLAAYEEARDYTERALSLHREAGRNAAVARSLLLAGLLHEAGGRPEEARTSYQECLELARKSGSQEQMGQVFMALGSSFEEQKDPTRAREAYQAARDIYRRLGDPVREALVRLAMSLAKQPDGRFHLDLGEIDRLRDVARSLDDPRITRRLHEIQALFHLDRGEWKSAVADLREAIAVVERYRAATVDPLLQASSLGGDAPLYVNLTLALAQMGDAVGAFQASEQARARSLTDLLERSRVVPSHNVPSAVRGTETRLREELAAATRQYRLAVQTPDFDAGRRGLYRRQMHDAVLAYEEFRRDLFLAQPGLRVQRGEGQPVNLHQVQKTIFARHPDLAILSYLSGKKKTLLIVLTAGKDGSSPARVKVHQVEIEARELALAVEDLRQACSRPDALGADTAPLWRALIAPAEEDLQGKKHLVIVPFSPLLTLPFQALRPEDGPYLLEQYTLSYAPSVTALVEMVRQGERKRASRLSLLAVGRPRFASDLKDLPASEQEVRALARLLGEDSEVLLGAEATRGQVEARLAKARYVHFATHGLINEARPLFSSLALTPSGPRDDGRLYAQEVLDLQLSADLVVLSACQTALGREYRGEGVLGLSWAFFVAGTPSVVVSQWSVADQSTSKLMQLFYRTLTENRAISKAEALRQAQLLLLKDRTTRRPFYWAPFVLVGSWLL